MIPNPKRGGTYLYCPMCAKAWRTRALPRYRRHIRRRHPAVLTASMFTGPGPIWIAPSSTQPGQPRWVRIGVADGFAIGRPQRDGDQPIGKPRGSISVQMPLHHDQPSGLLLNQRQAAIIEAVRNAQRS
jgi:hypothetical protein